MRRLQCFTYFSSTRLIGEEMEEVFPKSLASQIKTHTSKDCHNCQFCKQKYYSFYSFSIVFYRSIRLMYFNNFLICLYFSKFRRHIHRMILTVNGLESIKFGPSSINVSSSSALYCGILDMLQHYSIKLMSVVNVWIVFSN